jgi:hypothetical protein
MIHPIYRVVDVEIVADYTLCVRFDDGIEQTINFRPILTGELYSMLRDLQLFDQARVDPEVHTLVWPNGADFDPATLHDWSANKAVFIERAQSWLPSLKDSPSGFLK